MGIPAVSKHLDNIYEDGELDKNSTISILETVQKEGNREVKRNVEYYNLDAIISVGYRVNSVSEKYRLIQDRMLESDFDAYIKQISDQRKDEKYN